MYVSKFWATNLHVHSNKNALFYLPMLMLVVCSMAIVFKLNLNSLTNIKYIL